MTYRGVADGGGVAGVTTLALLKTTGVAPPDIRIFQ